MAVLNTSEVRSVMNSLRDVIPAEQLDAMQPAGPAAVYTTLATVWLMILQRLGGGLSMQAVVKDAIAHGPDIFPDCKRVREASLSTRDTAFSGARGRLGIDTVRYLLQAVSGSLIDACAPAGERSVFIVDGTTLTTAPTDDLKQAFPPARNQHGESVWPTVYMLVAHELNSGCALVPEIGAMYGTKSTSETAMFPAICRRVPERSVLLADAGFGMFGPVFESVQAGHSIAFRLSVHQWKSLHRQASPLEQPDSLEQPEPGESYALAWKPTRRNLATCPHIPADASINVLIHTVPFSAVIPDCDTDKQLYLVTTPDLTRQQAIALYLKRYDIEHDIRDVKVTLNTERIRAHSREMFEKELLTSLVAYNLVVQFRREAARKAGVPPRRLSFTGVWNTFQSFFLKLSPANTPEEWAARYARALDIASREVLRTRPGRSYPRQANPRRPKTTKFQKAQRKKQPLKPPEPATK